MSVTNMYPDSKESKFSDQAISESNENIASIAVTGALGNVGSRFIAYFPADYNLRLTDLRDGLVGSRSVAPLDLLDREKVVPFFKGTSAIVHCAIAAYKDEDLDVDHPSQQNYHHRLLDINIRGTYNIFEAARIHQVSKVVFISSLSIVMGHPFASGFSETLKPMPNNLYASSKFFGEQIGELYYRLYGINVVCLRLGQPYPLGNVKEKIWEKDPSMRAIFVSHGDIARAINCALKSPVVGFKIYNVLSRNAEGLLNCAASEIGYEPQDIL